MSDLTGKFGSFEEQIASNHTEIMDALNTIAFALGAPPTTPSINLGDVVAAITITNGLLTDIFNTVDSINNNASLNAQRLLTLMLQTACPCDNTVPMLPPPLLPTVTELEAEAKCQRIQFFLDMYASWVISVVVYLNDNGTISSFQVDNALALTFGSISQDDALIRPIPTGIRDSLTTLLNTSGSPSAINASIFDEITNGTVIADMRQALYAEDNALDGSPAAKAAALASGGPFASILAAAFYTNWANAIYGDLPEVDASGYDGSICAPDEPPVIVTESCSDRINNVQNGSYDSGDISMVGWTHARLGVAGGGVGIVTFYADGDSKFVLNISVDGADNYWVGSATNIRVVVASSADCYVHLRVCTGTYG